MKQFHFVYITINLINNKKYVGDHSTTNLNDGYLGSGKLILSAIKKYGKNNFKREILEYCSSKQIAFDAQEKYIMSFNTLNPYGYNISPKGGHQCKNGMSIESREKWLSSLKNTLSSKETRLKMSKAKKGKPSTKKGIKVKEKMVEKYGAEDGIKRYNEYLKKSKKSHQNVIQSKETREKRSKKLKGRKRPKEVCEKISKVLQGHTFSKETIEKIKITLKNKKIICEHCNKEIPYRNYYQWHGDKCKFKKS
jgi:hypothetical protein